MNKIISINKRGASADFSWLANLEKALLREFKTKFRKIQGLVLFIN